MLDIPPNATVERLSQPPDAGCGRYWIVAHTHPQAERWADTNLQRRGYQTYLPLLAVQRRDTTPRRLRFTLIPLFTGYLFVQLPPAIPWTPIRYAPGVASLLMAGGHPEQVRGGLVDALQATEEARRSVAPPTASWAPGTPCSLAAGAFAQHRAVVVSAGRQIATVALPVLGAIREVSVPIEWLETL